MALLIDTSVFIALERRGDPVEAVFLHSRGEPMALSAVTASELLVGLHRTSTQEQSRNRQAFVTRVFETLMVLPFDLGAARAHASIYADLQARGQLIGATISSSPPPQSPTGTASSRTTFVTSAAFKGWTWSRCSHTYASGLARGAPLAAGHDDSLTQQGFEGILGQPPLTHVHEIAVQVVHKHNDVPVAFVRQRLQVRGDPPLQLLEGHAAVQIGLNLLQDHVNHVHPLRTREQTTEPFR
ncbi:MAG: PIN domain-containing protein [Chloroflexi bacterium]|nr:PIN domain-containing protein [Chloroflexota bacterium]